MNQAVSFLLLSVVLLQGCTALVVRDGSRRVSLKAIGAVMAEEQPGIDSDEAAQCVLGAMSTVETVGLGIGDHHRGVAPEARAKIIGYAARPEATACLDGLAATEPAE